MKKTTALISQLHSLRNRFGKEAASKKTQLLQAISCQPIKSKKALQAYYDDLLFIIAYPDNNKTYTLANQCLDQLQLYIQSHGTIGDKLFNTGITHSGIAAAFGFEIASWMKQQYPAEIKFGSFETTASPVQAVLSVVMPKAESEILQDGNATWRDWLEQPGMAGEDLLEKLLAIFEVAAIRPEVKDELWNAMGINVEINLTKHCCLPAHLIQPYYHRSLIRKHIGQHPAAGKPTLVKLSEADAREIIYCSRTILIRQLREIDPVSFCAPGLITYYQLPRGLSIALMGMVPGRRHPIDSYMGYMVFKNGLPVAYAGSWILFDSGRIGLNVFPGYRGGESQYIFQQVLQLHRSVYNLKRFSVDPYQVGMENSDGIRSGAFWVYYHAGFRPLAQPQLELAAKEALEIKRIPGYRSPVPVLENLSSSRLQLLFQKRAVQFDATDLSRAWAAIVVKKYGGNRSLATKSATANKLAGLLGIKNYQEENMQFILENWSLLLLANEQQWVHNESFKQLLKELFVLKAGGREEAYIRKLQRATALRKYFEVLLRELDVPLAGI